MAYFENVAVLAPFKVRSFRFQWPADLLTSWAFEMETLILGWYVYVQTDSVFLLTAFGSLQFLGTLLAPMFGVVSDRLGRRQMLCMMRATYVILASIMMTLGMLDILQPVHVFVLASVMGLVRPSDLVMRNSLIGDTMPENILMRAMGLSRTTMDSARIAGAIAGAALFSQLGIGYAYIFVVSFYSLSFLLTLGIARPIRDPEAQATRMNPFRDLMKGLAYVWQTPRILAAMWLAFLVNLCAFPFTNGLLPYVAKDIYKIDATGLGYLVASFAFGALLASTGMALTGGPRRPARYTVYFIIVWFIILMAFGFMPTKELGMAALFLIGTTQGISMISMSVMLLNTAGAEFRGRVMGVRMLAVYSLPFGMMTAGKSIEYFGYKPTIVGFCLFGLAVTVAIAYKWRRDIWR